MNLYHLRPYPWIAKFCTVSSTSLVLAGLFNLQLSSPIASSTIPLRIKRWIEVRSVSGTVRHLANNRSEPAQSGQRLSQVGDGIETGSRSSAILAIDEGIGTLQVSENSRFTIQQIEAQNGGYQTQLSVARGQVRLKLRRFNNPASRLEIFTPAGVTGVRGTEFGVSILPSGKTGIATLDGRVAAAAQGKSVDIDRGFQSSVIPGRVPKDPSPLKDNPNLDIQIVRTEANGQIRIIGQTDDINVISLGEQTIEPNEQGLVDFQVPLQADRSVQLTVTTPLGKQKNYRFIMP
jgi:FecR protein